MTGWVSKPELWIASWAFLEASETTGEAILTACSPACFSIGNAASTPGFTASETAPNTCPAPLNKFDPTSRIWSIAASAWSKVQQG